MFEHLRSKASANTFEFVTNLVGLYTNLLTSLKPFFVSIFA